MPFSKTGQVLKWNSYENPDDPQSPIKPFWFVVLGDTGLIEEPTYLILVKATTQFQYYEEGALRSGNPILRLPGFADYGFDQQCLLDFGAPPKIEPEQEVERRIDSKQIEVKGSFSADLLKRCYELVLKSSYYSFEQKFHIKNAFNRNGITGLAEPKKRRRR